MIYKIVCSVCIMLSKVKNLLISCPSFRILLCNFMIDKSTIKHATVARDFEAKYKLTIYINAICRAAKRFCPLWCDL